MSDHDFDNWDMCPVCMEMYVDPKNYYCSAACREKARVFRRRFDRLVKFLRSLDFECQWKAGITLEIKLPEYLSYAYPDYSSTIEFGGYGSMALKEGTEELWRDIQKVVGVAMVIVLKSSYTFGPSNDLFGKDYITSRVQAFIHFDDYTFKCGKCQETFIKSQRSYDCDMKLCYNCAIQEIPF